MALETDVARHYTWPDFKARILADAAGPDGALLPERLSLLDEFHVGGAEATDQLLASLAPASDALLLDIGSGAGGPARRAARSFGAQVRGVDLTADLVALATDLSARAGLADRTAFTVGNALDLPFADASFDGAMMLHVGMNIADKDRLMAEVARVLRPGARFAVYDQMRLGDALPAYPLPWAPDAALSHLAAPDDYAAAAIRAGLRPVARVPRRAEALAFFAAMRAQAEDHAARGLPPPPSIASHWGADAAVKLHNLRTAIAEGVIAPVEMLFLKPAS